jgi:glycosyltransferase involved in cell wall biosynthesis
MLVSILIPCYNAERWIKQAIHSSIAQTWPEKEVIVVDDGSTDGSLEIIRSFGDRVVWETGPNRGGNAARNRLLELAHGEWLQYLDADDYLMCDKIERQMHFIAQHPEADIVFGPITLEHWSQQKANRELILIPEPHDPWVLLARWYLPQTGAPLWRKHIIREVGGWKRVQPCCQEHELYLRLLMAGKRFAYCACNGAVYRQWGEHTTCKRDKRELRRRRLEIEQHLEDFLRERGELTPARRLAINQTRFEIARTAWQEDRAEARAIINTIRASQPDFMPAGAAAPPHYQAVYHWLGFEFAEFLAKCRRTISSLPGAA